MWHEYPVPADFGKQKEIIRKLRKWIQQIEGENLIVGFAFNHYFSNPDTPDELRIRFEYKDEKNRESVEAQLEDEVKKILPSYVRQKRIWGLDTTDRHILQAYELGSRCVFLTWELIENGRFPEEYFRTTLEKIPFEFQGHFNHGVMNSLGIPKSPNETLVHIDNLMDSTKSKNKQELIKWLQDNMKEQ